MNRYTIYCTKSQTNKALVLGAPIERGHESSRYFNIGVPTFYDENDEICRVKNSVIFIPTAEEMIGWLEELISFIDIIPQVNNTWLYIVYPDDKSTKNITVKGFSSRKESVLAAIDAALDYLSNNLKK